jgi:hypothetical protein
MSTPINDKFTEFMKGADDATHLVALDLLSRELERKLTAARIALEVARIGMCSVGVPDKEECTILNDAHDSVCEALKSTEP